MMGTSCCSPLVFCWLLCNVRQQEVNSSPILRPAAACKPHCEESRWLSFRIKSHADNYKSGLLYTPPDSLKPSTACGTAEESLFCNCEHLCLWKALIEIWWDVLAPSDEGPRLLGVLEVKLMLRESLWRAAPALQARLGVWELFWWWSLLQLLLTHLSRQDLWPRKMLWISCVLHLSKDKVMPVG